MIIPVVIMAGIFVGISLVDSPPKNENMVVFHVTLADPELYVNGVYSKTFAIDDGSYHFGFVPNGSSPETLSIAILGDHFEFSENFELKNELHQTGISEYYTWSYSGTESFMVPESDEVGITINPNGNEMGSVSVYIFRK